MPRLILDISGIVEPGRLPFTKNQIYKLTRRRDYPIPYKKIGKKLLFDWERVLQWFDSLPGKDLE